VFNQFLYCNRVPIKNFFPRGAPFFAKAVEIVISENACSTLGDLVGLEARTILSTPGLSADSAESADSALTQQ
jgi:hypothetical protein